jgi:hypothetical protein
MRRMIVSLAACTLLSAAAYAGDSDSSAPVAEDTHPDATLTLKGGSVAAGIGYTWGHGELEYHNSSQRFSIKTMEAWAARTPPRRWLNIYGRWFRGSSSQIVHS